MSERVRRPGAPDARPVESLAAVEPAYDEQQVALILQRAAGLEQKRQLSRPALTLKEIEGIAAEAGLDPALVRQAARELAVERDEGLGARLAGAPLRRTIERTVDGELSVELHEQLAQDIRDALGDVSPMPVQVATLGRSLSFTSMTRGGVVEVQVSPRQGKTTITVRTNAGPLAGGLFGGLMGGIGGGIGSNVAWMVPVAAQQAGMPLPTAIGLGLAGLLGVLGGSYGLARALFVRGAGATQRRMEQLADVLEGHVREANARVAGPP